MIVVTGVHRSGTSLVAMLLDALGVDFGDHTEFYAQDQWNERGYFERRDVVDLNSRIITGFQRTSGSLSSALSQVRYLALPRKSAIHRRAKRLRPAIEELAPRLEALAVKDPRFSLTLSAWEPWISHCIICLRPPAEVAGSLYRRQKVPAPLALRFWNRHAEALLGNAPTKSLYISFTDLAGADPMSELERINDFLELGCNPSQLITSFRTRFEPDLKHINKGKTVDLPVKTRQLWEELEAKRL